MTSYEPQVGDIVRYEFRVDKIVEGKYVYTWIEDDRGNDFFLHEVELVERPEPTNEVTLTLTYDQVDALCVAASRLGMGNVWSALDKARRELSNG